MYEEGQLDAKGKRLLLEALASGDSALKMSSAVASARTVFRERELQENAELQAAISLGKYMQELKVWAQEEMDASVSQKARYLKGGSESSKGGRSSTSSRVGLLQMQDQDQTDFSASVDENLEWHPSTNNGSTTQDDTADEYNRQYMRGGEYGEQYVVQAYNQAAVNDEYTGQDGYAQQEQPREDHGHYK
ncbi:unnamed protein product [Ectocarpus sp. CCAP 1310/34]|nr:unnamed protein product [Ectocarpus sp. CCAP 1310/34]